MTPNNAANRRPLKTRQQEWARKLARFFVRLGVSPNHMSLAGLIVAILGAAALVYSRPDMDSPRMLLLIVAAVCIQLRLLANMLDGLMAVEEGKQTPTGPLYNELPDRLADVVLLVATGYASHASGLGWLAAVMAVLTAYVRALGASLTARQDYCGPMAKPHRMFVLTLGCVLAAFLPDEKMLPLALWIVVIGGLITVIWRTSRLASALSHRPHA